MFPDGNSAYAWANERPKPPGAKSTEPVIARRNIVFDDSPTGPVLHIQGQARVQPGPLQPRFLAVQPVQAVLVFLLFCSFPSSQKNKIENCLNRLTA
jgi:hypothetical protein